MYVFVIHKMPVPEPQEVVKPTKFGSNWTTYSKEKACHDREAKWERKSMKKRRH